MIELGTPLCKWDLAINYGVKTGFNDAFIISAEKKDELIAADPKSAELIRPILRGRDIKRYSCNFANLWIINVHNGLKDKNLPPIDINAYPAIKSHLDSYYLKLSMRADKGDTPYNLRNCAYMNDFLKQKIVYPETTQGAYFYLDNDGFFVDKTCFMMLSDTPEYLVATLSSRLFEYAYKRIFSSIELGQSAYQYNKHALLKLPVIRPEKVPQKEYEEIVLNVRALQETDSCKIASEHVEAIDEIINCIYNLTAEEIDYINS